MSFLCEIKERSNDALAVSQVTTGSVRTLAHRDIRSLRYLPSKDLRSSRSLPNPRWYLGNIRAIMAFALDRIAKGSLLPFPSTSLNIASNSKCSRLGPA
jgi:hypothetical protein